MFLGIVLLTVRSLIQLKKGNTMNISSVTNAQRVGKIVLHSSHALKLALEPDPQMLGNPELRDNSGRVYFITIDGKIVKIGGSQCKGGIQGTISAYLGGFAKGMSPRSYCGWNYIRQAIKAGQTVEFYFILAPIITAQIPTMNSIKTLQIPVDYHSIETDCVQEYLAHEKDYPYLNVQESGRKWRDLTGPLGESLLAEYSGII